MKLSLNWLKRYIQVNLTADELSHKLTMAGIEVEKVSKENNDVVFDLEVTPNRPDCLNVIGFARELSAILDQKKQIPSFKPHKMPTKKYDIQVDDKKDCARYIGTLIENVHVKPAVDWMESLLKSIGVRTVNNLVDITNFCLMETGQPMHAFDADKISGNKIIVRRAKKGEKIVMIDGVERELDPSILVIADDKKPVAVAGIMGGKESEVTEKTHNVLLESAYFDPVLIRRAARKLGLSTDSSYRFERGVDFDMVESGANRAIDLILELAKGDITKKDEVKAVSKLKLSTSIVVSIEQINGYLNDKLSIHACKKILNNLDFEATLFGKNKIKITPPSFRGDIKQEVDIVEEIARIVGYDNLPSTTPLIKPSQILPDEKRQKRNAIRKALLSQGLNEIITYTMVNKRSLEKTRQESLSGISIINPLSQDQEILRPALLASHLNVLAANINHQQKDLTVFETGKIYIGGSEKEVLAVALSGKQNSDWRNHARKTVNYYDLKGVLVKTIQDVFGAEITVKHIKKNYFDETQSVAIFLKGQEIGEMGLLSDEVVNNFDIKNAKVLFAQLDLEKLLKEDWRHKKFVPVCEFPAIIRDVSLAIKTEINFADITQEAFLLGEGILKSIDFIEEYLGEKIQKGYRGIVFSCSYQSDKKTLTDDEITKLHQRIVASIIQKFSAIQR